jgi:hypothetical protein
MEEHKHREEIDEQVIETEEHKEPEHKSIESHSHKEHDHGLQDSQVSAKQFEGEDELVDFQHVSHQEHQQIEEPHHHEQDNLESSTLMKEKSKSLLDKDSSEIVHQQILLKSSGNVGNHAFSQKVNTLNNSNAETKKKTSELNKARLQQLAEETKAEKHSAKEALDAGKVIFNVECCVNCSAHSYCTHHDESKYASMFFQLKQQIEAVNPTYYVAKNLEIANPRIGAFEIFHKNTLVYSKLSTMNWPKVSLLLKRLESHDMMGGKENQVEKDSAITSKTAEKRVLKQTAPLTSNNIAHK